jgi:AcrR family transcriptional regulator
MITEMKKRKYTLRKRGERQEETKQRIVDAAIALHEQVGPKFTTISAIAERAGVERLTVYRHFPTEEAIFSACSAKWYATHLHPDPALWQNMDAPNERSRTALCALYQFYRSTEAMWTSLYRDASEVPALKNAMQASESYLGSLVNDLIPSWKASASRQPKLRAAASHAVRFSTWQSLRNLQDDEIAQLMVLWLEAIAHRQHKGAKSQRNHISSPPG